MGHIQDEHITNNNSQVTNADTFGVAGNHTLTNQDEKHILDMTVATIRCAYSPLGDGCVDGSSRVPNTYASESPSDKESIRPTEH